jgi:CBS domain-containing protein
MKTVKDILREKGSDVATVKPDDTVYHALTILADKDIGALVVVDDQGKAIGLMSERDYARKVFLKGMSSPKTLVRNIMADKVCYTEPGCSVEECLALVTETRSRHLPVIEDDKLVGLVSIGDLVKATIAEKEFLINQLTHYIKSG